MKAKTITSDDFLTLLNELGWPIVITKNKIAERECNFRFDITTPGRCFDGYWNGKPTRVTSGEGFCLHYVEHTGDFFLGEYQGVVAKESDPARYSLILGNVEQYVISDLDQPGDSQRRLLENLHQAGAVTYSYFKSSSSLPAVGKCYDMAQVKIRLQQRAFRIAVFSLHTPVCKVTGCAVEALLDAAHLSGRHWYEGHNKATDGIPLRADVHRALDAGLIELDEEHRLAYIDRSLLAEYSQYLAPK